MAFITKKTTDLTLDEKNSISMLFEEVFKEPCSVESFVDNYTCNFKGYSYHTLFLEDGKVVGVNSMVPIEYSVNGKRMLFVNAGGTMIAKSYRGIDNFCELIDESFNFIQNEGYNAYIGFPNDNSYPLYLGLGLMDDIGELDTYILPCKIGKFKKQLSFLDSVSFGLSKLYVKTIGIIGRWKHKAATYSIEKCLDTFEQFRYKRNQEDYIRLSLNNQGAAYYRVKMHEGFKTAFIVDVIGKTAENFRETVNTIMSREKNRIDLILYVGKLPFGMTGLIKVPQKYVPKRFHFTGHILNNSIEKTLFTDIQYWDINLSNYDLI